MSNSLPLLSTLILFPCLAAASLMLVRGRQAALLTVSGAAAFELGLSILLLVRFDFASDQMQLTEHHSWIPSLNVDYALGVDGLSVLFPPCTALVTLAVILASWTHIRSMTRLYLGLLLLSEGITIGIFCALDLGVFFLFWELALIPIYFLISLWGIGPHRRFAAAQYTLIMLSGGVPLLFAILVLAINHAQINELPIPEGLTFSYATLLDTHSSSEMQTSVFFLLLLAFGIKTPLFPFHTWLPTIAMEGPVGVTALLTGLKVGVYGLLRFAIPLAPEAAIHWAWLLAALGTVGLFHGALLALKETNFRRLLAYASISHVGLVVVGLASMNIQGLQGAVLQLVNFSFISGGLFLIAGFLHQRLGSTELTRLGGLAPALPQLTSFVFVLGLASIGVPGTNGFAAEFLLILGAFQAHTGFGLSALFGVVLSSAYFLVFFRKAFLGTGSRGTPHLSHDLRSRELAVVATLAGLCLLIGLFPRSITTAIEPAALAWVKRAAGGFPDHPSAFALVNRDELPGPNASTR